MDSDSPGTALVPGRPHRLAWPLARMREHLAGVAGPGCGLSSCSDETIVGLLDQTEALAAQLEGLRLRLIEQVDRRGLGTGAGAASTAAWLTGRYRRHPAGSGRDVKLGRALDRARSATADALAAGLVNADQARAVTAAVDALPTEVGPAVVERAEAHLLSEAAHFDAQQLRILGRKILAVVDPELADRVLARQLAAEEARADRRRELSLMPDPDGSGSLLRGRLDPLTADMFDQALDPLARPRPTDADGPDTRTPAQRRGDALHELLRRYLASGESPTRHGLKPQVVVTVTDLDLVRASGLARLLHSGSLVSACTVQQLACDARVGLARVGGGAGADPALTDPVPTDPARLFVGRLRRLLELRDQGCAFPGCDRPCAWCEGHHIVSWLRGGATSLENGVLLCGHHHRLIHSSPWAVRMADDGYPEFIPPDYIDPRRKPLRNTRLRL